MYNLDQSQSVDVIESFAINMEAGWITTLRELDHEKRDSYQIKVVASDHGEGSALLHSHCGCHSH